MSEHLEWWMDRYVAAWDSNDADDIAGLFDPEAVYDTQTADGPWHGVDAIVAGWQAIDDTPGNWEFDWQPLVETDDIAVVTGRTTYLDPPASYRNLFVIQWHPDNGLCRDFTEWWIDEDPT
ncbi:MAG TPA: nuclear transport factor 2 family protein [Acidimicrobiia bacterium]|nr:nuclear transport factor 2 family protein [Acidimicrobiia bacterium]